jgi:hypothetical protein
MNLIKIPTLKIMINKFEKCGDNLMVLFDKYWKMVSNKKMEN